MILIGLLSFSSFFLSATYYLEPSVMLFVLVVENIAKIDKNLDAYFFEHIAKNVPIDNLKI